jgi:hypothetical protein
MAWQSVDTWLCLPVCLSACLPVCLPVCCCCYHCYHCYHCHHCYRHHCCCCCSYSPADSSPLPSRLELPWLGSTPPPPCADWHLMKPLAARSLHRCTRHPRPHAGPPCEHCCWCWCCSSCCSMDDAAQLPWLPLCPLQHTPYLPTPMAGTVPRRRLGAAEAAASLVPLPGRAPCQTIPHAASRCHVRVSRCRVRAKGRRSDRLRGSCTTAPLSVSHALSISSYAPMLLCSYAPMLPCSPCSHTHLPSRACRAPRPWARPRSTARFATRCSPTSSATASAQACRGRGRCSCTLVECGRRRGASAC